MNRAIHSRGFTRYISKYAAAASPVVLPSAAIGGALGSARLQQHVATVVAAAATQRHSISGGGALLSRGFAADAGAAKDDAAMKEAATAAAASSAADDEADAEQLEKDARRRQRRDDEDESHSLSHRILSAAMKHVAAHGWSDAALRAAATDLGYSAALLGQLPRGTGQLVEHFVEDCDSRLSVEVSRRHDELAGMTSRERLLAVMKWRLAMLEPVIETWASAVAIQAKPENVPTTLQLRALLADEMCIAAGPGLSLANAATAAGFGPASAGWYADRAAVAALYSASELFLLTDSSPNFADTHAFVEKRIIEMSELGKTVEELSGFAAAAAKGLGIGALPFPPLPGREVVEGLIGKVVSAVISGTAKK
mmetsp:Transcript_30491/g.75770  ORF Transcript_30491/g.75770 Transcript_30491/m.75770 type:complete len:368 (-) Transcript_30491:2377-3480(-)